MKVFWSWQSDTLGKTGRHFVRNAISEAIIELQSSDEVLEPDARDLKREMHIDHDRKGITGSPDLAAAIFDKIDHSTVFIADVTPVACIERENEGGEIEEKKSINSNVAIELGYALKALGTEWVLFVCNRHYGSRDDLPFDLKHKSGPIFYELAPGASNEEIKNQQKKLVKDLKVALRAFLDAAAIEGPSEQVPFEPVKASGNTGVFFEYFDSVVETSQQDRDDQLNYDFKPDCFFSLRLFPRWDIQKKFARHALRDMIIESNLSSFQKNGGSYRRVNQFGAVCFELRSNAGRLNSLTQVFQSGEIWGLSKDFTRDRFGTGIIVPNEALEYVLWHTLHSYVQFGTNYLKIEQDFECRFSGIGLGEARLSTPQLGLRATSKFLESRFEVQSVVNLDSIDRTYDSFREALYDAVGLSPPTKDAARI